MQESDIPILQGTMKIPKIKNYNPAPVQITAEQLMREVPAYRTDEYRPPSSIHVMDQDELKDYKYRMRKEFEEKLRMQRHHIGTWIKYAEWEANIGEFARSRSVFERALDIEFQNISLWLKYAEMEMRNKNVNHARNIWERACRHLPRVDQFWYKYCHMEEMLGEIEKARNIYEEWMSWQPNENAWDSYLSFEQRHGDDMQKCRSINQRFTEINLKPLSYLKAAQYEQKHQCYDQARKIYERALSEIGNDALDENFLIHFISFEIQQRDYQRADILFKYAIEKLPSENSKKISKKYLNFQKQYGSKEVIEELVLQRKKNQIEEEILKDQYNYDLWFDLLRIEENRNKIDIDLIREIYERAIENQPHSSEKQNWNRYIYLWLNYAAFEEIQCKSIDRAQSIYEKILQIIETKTQFSFSKLWIKFAEFHIRNTNIENARKTIGKSLGKFPRKKIFKFYSELELLLGNFERCRKIFERQIQVFSFESDSWVQYALFENSLGEFDRARQIFELALQQQNIDMAESLWKNYIDLEIQISNKQNTGFDKVRILYQRLLDLTKHQKVWISYSKFEEEESHDFVKARQIYEQANLHFSEQPDNKEQRAQILQSWYQFEQNILQFYKDKEYEKQLLQIQQVEKLQPKLVKINKEKQINQVNIEQENIQNDEEYEYIFPDNQVELKNKKLLEIAKKWKENIQ